MQKYIIRSTALLVSVLTTVGFLEIAFRWADLVAQDERSYFFASAMSWPLDHFPKFDGPQMSAFVAHPFWGFTINKNVQDVNNMGFDDPENFPYVPKQGETIIGLIGGSVAQLSGQEIRNTLMNELRKHLPKDCEPNVKLLNLAISAHKQPSQFHVYSFFAEQLDLSVSIDGYNDTFTTSGEDNFKSYPLFYNELFEMTSQKLRLQDKKYSFSFWQYHLVRLVYKNSLLLKSDVAFFLLKKIFYWLESKKNAVTNELRKPILLLSHEELLKNRDVWIKYIFMQHTVARSYNKKSYFFLQPSQYSKGGKIFSAQEKDIAIVKNPQMLAMYKVGFRELSDAAQDLKKKGIEMIDLSDLFAKTEEAVFIDDCCHLNVRGNQMLAKTVIAKILPEILRRHQCLKAY